MNKAELTDVQKINLKNNIDTYSLAEKRKSRQVSMHLLAEASGCSSSDYNDYEHGKKPFNKHVYRKAMKHLDPIGQGEKTNELLLHCNSAKK